MHALLDAMRKCFIVGGWAPLLVFVLHVAASQAGAYDIWPPTDIPMHVAGGFAIALFLSGLFRALPRDLVRKSRIVVLELVLVFALATTAAVIWEFAEFGVDQAFGTNVQVSLANTMKDLALGMAGAGVFLAFRARQMNAGPDEIRALVTDWMAGHA